MQALTVPRRIPKNQLGNKEQGYLLSEKAIQWLTLYIRNNKKLLNKHQKGPTLISIKESKNHLNFPVIEGQKGLYAIYEKQKGQGKEDLEEDAIIKGGFGSVTTGQNVKTGEWVSVKIQKYRIQDKKREKEIEQEILFSKKAGILKDLITIKTTHQKKIYMVCKLIGKGDDLFYHLSYATVKDKVYTFDEKLDLVLSVIKDLKKRFHDNNLIHCDIKPENIVYDQKNRRAMLIDYGAICDLNQLQKGKKYEITHFERKGKIFYAKTKLKTTQEIDDNTYFNKKEIIGTRGYISPEAILGNKQLISKKLDIYAMGMCIYYLITINKKDERSASPFILKLYRLASNMCNYDPRERPNVSSVLTQLKQIKYDWEKTKVIMGKERIKSDKRKNNEIKNDEDINAMDRKGRTPLIKAIESNDIEMIILLITDKRLNWKIHQFVLKWVKSTPVYKLINHLADSKALVQE